MVLASMCLRTWSADVSRTGATMSRRPALEIKTSSLVIEYLEASSATAAAGSVSTVESILTIMSLESLPTGTEARDIVAEAMSRTAATTVVSGRAIMAERRPFPMPLLAPVIT